ncbi:MAG: hypothetical protein V4649_07090 [Bacteroidota bacterium]
MNVEVLYKGGRAKLLYSQSILMLDSVGIIKLNPNSHPDDLLGWSFNVEFTDEMYNGTKSPQIQASLSANIRNVHILCSNWYGEEMENNLAQEVFSKMHLITFLVKIKSTSLLSKPQKRNVEISIWQKI